VRDGVGVIAEQDHLAGRRAVGTAVLQDEVPQDERPQPDLDRVIQAPPGKIDSGSAFPKLGDECPDFRLERGLVV
jgi:hypothetical protein